VKACESVFASPSPPTASPYLNLKPPIAALVLVKLCQAYIMDYGGYNTQVHLRIEQRKMATGLHLDPAPNIFAGIASHTRVDTVAPPSGASYAVLLRSNTLYERMLGVPCAVRSRGAKTAKTAKTSLLPSPRYVIQRSGPPEARVWGSGPGRAYTKT
jgi:hypothetical protein